MSVLFSVPYAIYLNPFSSEQLLPLTLSTVILREQAREGPCVLRRHFLYLPELQLDRCRAAKDRDHHFQRLAVFVHLIHGAIKVGKRAISNADSLVLFKLHANLGLVFAHVHAIDDLVDLFFSQWRWIVGRADKPGHPWRRFHAVPHMVALATTAETRRVHLHQNVAGIKHPLHGIFLAVADLRNRLRGNHYFADLLSQAKSLYARFQ